MLILISAKLLSITENDSLETILSQVDEEEKVKILNKLSNKYCKATPEISFDYASQAYELAQKNNDEHGKADALNNIGHYYRKTHNFEQAFKHFQHALSIYEKLDEDRNLANVYDNIGHTYWIKGDFPNALDNYKKAKDMFIVIDDAKRLSKSYNNIGSVYFRLGMYDESMINLLKSLSIREKTNDPKIPSTLNNLGNIYVRLCDYEKALEMYHRSLEYKLIRNENPESTLNNIGNIHLKLKDYDSALKYLSEALEINKENKDDKRIATSLNNIALVYEEQGKIDKALTQYLIALDLKQETGDDYGYANTAKNLGSIFLSMKDYEQADFYLQKSLVTAREIKARDIIKDVYNLISEYYYSIKDYQNAYLYKNYCSSIADSLFNEETSDKITQYRTNFTIEKAEREKELLIKDNQIYKLKVEKINSWRITLFLLILLLTMTAISLYCSYYKKKKLNKSLTESNEKLEYIVTQRTSELVEANEKLKREIDKKIKTGTQLELSLKEKDVMLKEIHHRVQNNLQVISSILDIQLRSSDSEEFKKLFTNTQDRILSMSLVQEQLYRSDNLALLNFNSYIRSLVHKIYGTYKISTKRIKPVINIQDIHLNIHTAIPCGLLINEIITNSIKHGFAEKEQGEIQIKMEIAENDYYQLEISNNGNLPPKGFNYKKSESTGMELIRILIKQLRANVELICENGVTYKIKFKTIKK